MAGRKNNFYSIDFALLQSYLLEMFENESKCHHNFDRTSWFLEEKYTDEINNQLFDYLRKNGVNCDCEIISKLNAEDFTVNLMS